MRTLDAHFDQSSAWRIFPLGGLLGLFAIAPLLYYLYATLGDDMDTLVFLFGALSVVMAYLVVLLVFLWVAEWATQGSLGERFDKE